MCRRISIIGVLAVFVLGGCGTSIFRNLSRGGGQPPRVILQIEEQDRESLAAETFSVERSWICEGVWDSETELRSLSIGLGGKDGSRYGVWGIQLGEVQSDASSARGSVAAVDFTLERDAATIHVVGDTVPQAGPRDVGARGTATIDVHSTFVAAVEEVVGERPSLVQVVQAALYDLDGETVRRFGESGTSLTLDEIFRLKIHRVAPDEVKKLGDAGYDFSVNELVRLKNHRVSVDDAVELREAGFDFDAGELIRLHNYRVEPEFIIGLEAASFERNLDEMIRLKTYRIPADFVATVKECGLGSTTSEIVRLHTYRVSADELRAFREAGYSLTADEVIRLKTYNVRAAFAKELSDLGYGFSAEELIRLKQWRITTDYARALADPDHEPLSAEELIDLKRRHVDLETVSKLRRLKKVDE